MSAKVLPFEPIDNPATRRDPFIVAYWFLIIGGIALVWSLAALASVVVWRMV